MPKLVVLLNGSVPYGQCSDCIQKFKLVLIGSDVENTKELQRQFTQHLNVAHRYSAPTFA